MRNDKSALRRLGPRRLRATSPEIAKMIDARTNTLFENMNIPRIHRDIYGRSRGTLRAQYRQANGVYLESNQKLQAEIFNPQDRRGTARLHTNGLGPNADVYRSG